MVIQLYSRDKVSLGCSYSITIFLSLQEDFLTNFRTCAKEAEMCVSFLWEQKYFRALLFFSLPSIDGQTPVGDSSDTSIYLVGTTSAPELPCRLTPPKLTNLAVTSKSSSYPTTPGSQPWPGTAHLQNNACPRV